MSTTRIQSFDGNILIAGDLILNSSLLKVDSTTKRVGVGKSNPGSKLDINGTLSCDNININGIINSYIPTGGIVLWHGTIATIPSGFQLCDGTNSTPDLRSKFVRGASPNISPGPTGGADTYTLAYNNIPSHTHPGYATTSQSGHEHTMRLGNLDNRDWDGQFGQKPPADSSRSTQYYSIESNSSNHTHNQLTVNQAGSGQAFTRIPPYYALAYIMKL